MTSEQITASGKWGVFEHAALLSGIQRHVSRLWWWHVFAQALALAVLTIAHWFLAPQLPPGNRFLSISLAVVYVIAVVVAAVGIYRVYLLLDVKAWYRRGVPVDIDLSYRVASEGLRYESSFGTGVFYWSSLNGVLLYRNYWLILSAANAHIVPRRFFSSLSDERAFISSVLDHISPAARAISKEAKVFVS